MLRRRPPVLPAILIGGVIPVAVGHARFVLPVAARTLKEIADEIVLLEGELDLVGRLVVSGAEGAAAECDGEDDKTVEVVGLHGW